MEQRQERQPRGVETREFSDFAAVGIGETELWSCDIRAFSIDQIDKDPEKLRRKKWIRLLRAYAAFIRRIGFCDLGAGD